jgi:hypothetical protein
MRAFPRTPAPAQSPAEVSGNITRRDGFRWVIQAHYGRREHETTSVTTERAAMPLPLSWLALLALLTAVAPLSIDV